MRALALTRVGLFVLALVLPLSRTYPKSEPLPNEQRTRAPLPSLAVAGSRYPEQFDAFFRDNFGGRDHLIHWHNLLTYHVFHESPVAKVIVGYKGWLFLSTPEDGIDIRNFAGEWPHEPSEVDAWLDGQDARRGEYATLGARFLIAVAPDKQTLYPELVPARYGPQAPGVLDELLQRLPAHPRLDVVDLRQVLGPHRDEQLYFKGDSHWNAKGAFLAAQAITDRLRPSMPSVGVIRESDYALTASPVGRGDLVNMLALDLTLPDHEFSYQRTRPAKTLVEAHGPHSAWDQPGPMPRALLIGDSYGAALAPILADAFSHLHYYMSSLGGRDPGLVAREKPDVVILICVERYLPRMSDR